MVAFVAGLRVSSMGQSCELCVVTAIENINFETMKMNFCKSTFISFVALSVLFLALPGFAGESALQVKCVDVTGAMVPDVKVQIAGLNTPDKLKDKKSNAQGVAEFTKLDDGAYRVFGRKEGFAPALYEFAVLKASQQAVTLKFQPGADKKLYFEDPAEAGRAQSLLVQALDAYKQNKFAEAEKLFTECLAINPSYTEALYYLAMAQLQQSKYDEGVATLDRTAEMAQAWMTTPSPAPTYNQIYQSAQALKAKMPGIKGENAMRAKNYELAAKEFSEGIKSNPNEPEYHANLAIALTNSRRFDEALVAIDNAIKLKPNPEYTKLRDQIAARKENAVLEKAQALLDEGSKLLQLGDAATALKKFEEAKGMVPQDKQAPVWRQIGRAQGKLGQPEAVASFKKSLELASAAQVAEFTSSYAQYYLDAKKYEEALDVLMDPKSVGVDGPEKTLLNLAKTSSNKEPALAEAALERVLKLNPANIDAMFDLGQLYYFDGKVKDSRSKELLTKYTEQGKDEEKLGKAKDMLIVINRRSK